MSHMSPKNTECLHECLQGLPTSVGGSVRHGRDMKCFQKRRLGALFRTARHEACRHAIRRWGQRRFGDAEVDAAVRAALQGLVQVPAA